MSMLQAHEGTRLENQQQPELKARRSISGSDGKYICIAYILSARPAGGITKQPLKTVNSYKTVKTIAISS